MDLPEGFRYRPEFISRDDEAHLAVEVGRLPFAEVRMHGVVARRRSAHFGWLYDYESFRVTPAPPIPELLLPLRTRVAAFAGVAPEELGEVLVQEYPAGAGIGWHRDAPMFGVVAGVSLLGRCTMRLRPSGATGRGSSLAVALEPRSVYLLSGPARTQWQHHIPAAESLRYSITFRTLRTAR
jgi:alkylated DNA repair dioxygenase AlkB